MMKWIHKMTLFVVTGVLMTSLSFAEPYPERLAKEEVPAESYLAGSTQKLMRGLSNLVFGLPFEPFIQADKTNSQYYLESGGRSSIREYLRGVPLGFQRGFQRAFVGIYEVATFFVPQEPIMEPELILETPHLDTQPHLRAMSKHKSFEEHHMLDEPVYH